MSGREKGWSVVGFELEEGDTNQRNLGGFWKLEKTRQQILP